MIETVFVPLAWSLVVVCVAVIIFRGWRSNPKTTITETPDEEWIDRQW
jgi:hypothetical protein